MPQDALGVPDEILVELQVSVRHGSRQRQYLLESFGMAGPAHLSATED
jgi:hypothetical protein